MSLSGGRGRLGGKCRAEQIRHIILHTSNLELFVAQTPKRGRAWIEGASMGRLVVLHHLSMP